MESWRGRAWTGASILAGLVFGASLAVFGIVLGRISDASTAEALPGLPPPRSTEAPAHGISAGPKLRYLGTLPAGLDASHFVATTTGADIAFELPAAGQAGGVAIRYWVPVASPFAGVDALTSAQLAQLLNTPGTTWASLGGVGGAATVLVPPDLPPSITASAASPASYEAIAAELARTGSPAVALLPIDRLPRAAVPIALDGVDIARGHGDPAAWPLAERVMIRALTEAGARQAPNLEAQLTAPLPTITRVVATGDILQSRCSLAKIEASGDWGAALRGAVGEYVADADLALGSLDGSIQDINEPYRCVVTTNLSSPPQVMEALTLAGFDEMTVATNHVFDCGVEWCGNKAFLQTLDRLHGAGIKTVGGGRNLEEALAPAIFEVNGIRFGVLGFDDVAARELGATDTVPGTAPLDDDYSEETAAGEPAFYRPASELEITRFVDRIRQLKTQVDVVIVQVQTGTEDTHDPTGRSIKALRAAADAGADLIVGNQAHWAQAVEVRGNSFIAYALGNFIFDQVWTPEHTQGYLLEATFHGKQLAGVRLVPYQIADRYKPEFVAGDLRAKVLRDVIEASTRLP